MNEKFTVETALFGYVDEDSALEIDNYPYGFRLRTNIRYWIETTKHGDRFCSQTLNPKTGKWNKPKKSTYVEVGVMFVDEENGHIKWAGVGHHADDEWLERFIAITKDRLSEIQVKRIKAIIGVKRAFEHVTFSIHSGPRTPEEEAEQKEAEANLRKLIAVKIHQAQGEEL